MPWYDLALIAGGATFLVVGFLVAAIVIAAARLSNEG